MKKLFFVIATTAFTTLTKAQDTSATMTDTQDNSVTVRDTYTSPDRNTSGDKSVILSIGVEPTIPIGHFNDLSGFGLGGFLQSEFKPASRVGITVNAGYIDYFGKTVNGLEYPDFKYWPVLGGLKLYMSEKSYVHGQAGAGFGTNDLGTSFWYGGGIGTNLGKAITAELKYTGWKQKLVTATTNTNTNGNGGIYGGTEGGTGTTTTTVPGGIYGGHYSTIGLRLAYNF